MQPSKLISLNQLHEEQYSKIICYPKHDLRELKQRLRELNKLGVTAIEFVGEKSAFNVRVLGKGCVGIVVVALTEHGKAALKVRRVDADRGGMQHEAEMLKRANAVSVGPCLLGTTENFLLMEFVDGTLLPQWVETVKGRGTRSKIRRVLREILEQCWRLDELGLDHGELSRAPRHIIVDSGSNPCLVDFETGSLHRRISNVTSICQYLFIGSQTAKAIVRKLGEIDRVELIDALRTYKQQRTRGNFEKILSVCGLQNV